jgi:hypothetical protein
MPSIQIIDVSLLRTGANIQNFDPIGMSQILAQTWN